MLYSKDITEIGVHKKIDGVMSQIQDQTEKRKESCTLRIKNSQLIITYVKVHGRCILWTFGGGGVCCCWLFEGPSKSILYLNISENKL